MKSQKDLDPVGENKRKQQKKNQIKAIIKATELCTQYANR